MKRRLILPAALAAAVTACFPTSTVGAAAGGFRPEAVSWAVSQVGHREQGTTNCSKRILRWERDMRLGVPPCREWCGAFVHQAFLRAGVRLSARLIDPDRSYADAVAGRRGLRRIDKKSVKTGDLLFFRFRKNLRASHFAIVRSAPRNGKVRTVEGNVEHAAVLRTRGLRYAVLAARIDP